MNKLKFGCRWAIAIIALSALTVIAQPGPPPLPPIPPQAFDFWSLAAAPWESEYNDAAISFTNLATAPSWDYAGTSLCIDTNLPAYLQLPVYDNGWTNITFDSGSLEIWCAPRWTCSADGGTGPTNWATLWDIGSYRHDASIGAWLMTIDPSGSNLVWVAQSDGTNQVLASGVEFDAGDWHQIVATWSPTNSCLYVDGTLMTNAGPILYGPSEAVCLSNGFCVGSISATGTIAGLGQFHGHLQYLISYDYPLSADDVSAEFAQVSGFIGYFGYNAPGSGGHFHSDLDDGPPDPGGDLETNEIGSGGVTNAIFTPPAPISPTNYAAYNQFYLTVTNDATNCNITICNTLSNLTYLILTNSDLAATNWNVWQILLASNGVTPALPLTINPSNSVFFEAELVSQTGTNGISDWWQMAYFGMVGIDPYADPDADGLCNLDEFNLGTNPTNANSISTIHNDAQALFLAYTNDPACHYQLTITNGSDTNTLLVTLSPTVAGTNYQMYSRIIGDSTLTWRVETNFIGSNSSATIPIYLNGRSLKLVGGYAEDDDGDGLPTGYEVLATLTDPFLPDTGLVGIGDGYKDPDADGYVNLQEMANGTNPHVFDTPAGPNSVSSSTITPTNFVLSWPAADGPVTGYVITIGMFTNGFDYISVAFTNSPSQLTLAVPYSPTNVVVAQVQTLYGTILSLPSAAYTVPFGTDAPIWYISTVGGIPNYSTPAAIVNGPGGNSYLLLSQMLPNLKSVHVGMRSVSGNIFPCDDQDEALGVESERYCQTQAAFPFDNYDGPTNFAFDVEAARFTNGIAQLTADEIPPYASFASGTTSIQCVNSNGCRGDIINFDPPTAAPFIDATQQMKQNIAFQARANLIQPFEYILLAGGLENLFTGPTGYVYSDFWFYDTFYGDWPYDSEGVVPNRNPFEAVEDNYFYRNYIADSTDNFPAGGGAGDFTTGAAPPFLFPTLSYLSSSNNTPIPGLLDPTDTTWAGSAWDPPAAGVSITGGSLFLSNGAVNGFGLPIESLNVELTNGATTVVTPGQTTSGYGHGAIAMNAAQPEFQTVDYYFALIQTNPVNYGIYGGTLAADPLPGFGNAEFSVTNTTDPLMLGVVGQPMTIAGYAKQAILNGYPNMYAYLGQYFTNAFAVSNGVITSNSAGIVSEYGDFFPIVPGQIALMTKPDPDQTNRQGVCMIDVVRLSLDVNHDGIIDESFTGPDNTTASAPYEFWVNNDNDGTGVGADINVAAKPSEADFTYGNIRSQRNLEDFARLWISGLPKLPETNGYNVNLSMTALSGNPAINIYASFDTNGTLSYLSDSNAAIAQFTKYFLGDELEMDYAQQLKTINPTQCYNLPIFGDGSVQNTHLLFEGAGIGEAQLTLTVSQTVSGVSNVLAQSSAFIDLHDIKDFYERAIITNDYNGAISNWASGIDLIQPATASFGNDTNIIVFIHGINVGDWDWMSDSETVYKRLYWAGYGGTFATVKWPCEYFNAWTGITLDTSVFNRSEIIAYKSGAALATYLGMVRSRFDGYHLTLFAHSQGNAITGEALERGAPFDTYILTQGAMPASAYDIDTPTNAALLAAETNNSPTPDWQPMGYHGVYTNLTGNIINFYNTNDPVLGVWLFDQNYGKPDGYLKHLLIESTYNYYTYDGTNGWHTIVPVPELVVDPQESRAMIARSRTESIGRQGPPSGHGIVQDAVDLKASFGFGGVFPDDHSAQWTHPIQATLPYYNQIRTELRPPL